MDVGGAGTQLVLTAGPVDENLQVFKLNINEAVGRVHTLGTVDADADLVQTTFRQGYDVAIPDDGIRAVVVFVGVGRFDIDQPHLVAEGGRIDLCVGDFHNYHVPLY